MVFFSYRGSTYIPAWNRFLGFSLLMLAIGSSLSSAWSEIPSILPDKETLQEAISLRDSISLTEALQWADDSNLQILAAKKNLRLSQLDIRIAKQIPNPQYTGVYTWGRLYTLLSYPQQFGINQLVETGGKRRKRTDVARAQLTLTDLQFNALRWDIRSQVRQAYAGLLAAEQNSSLVDAQIGLFDRLVDIATKRVKAGDAPGSELYQAKLARNQLGTKKNEAVGQVEQGQNQLNSLLANRLPPQFDISDTGLFQVRVVRTEIAPPSTMALPVKEELYQKAMAGRIDLKALRQEKVVTQKQLRLTEAQRIPDLTVLAGYQFAITPKNFYGTTYFGGPNIGTSVELPILHNQGNNIAKLKTTISQNDLRIKDLERQIKLDIDTAYTHLKVAQENIQLFQKDLIPEGKKVLYLAERSYQVGKTPMANVILAQQSFQQVISDYTQTVVNYQYAWGELEKSVGSPLNAW